MIVNLLSSNRRPYVKYALGLLHLLLTTTLQQPLIVNAEELNGLEACQNRCFDRSECDEVGNGDCCQWDDNLGQCMSRISHDICPGTSTIPPPPALSSIACHPTPTAIALSVSVAPRNLEAESAPTKDEDGRCRTDRTWLEYFICTGFSITQLSAVIISYKISAALSIFGSIYVVQDVLRDPKKRKESIYHRIMLGLSSTDIFLSFFGPFLGTWVMPRGSQVFAVGSNFACSIAGFFTTMTTPMTPLYNCSLATFYLLKLRFNWNDRKIKAIEKWLLFVPCTVGLISSITAAVVKGFFPYGYGCTLSYVSIAMFLVYLKVRSVEKQAGQYSFARFTAAQKRNMKMSRRIMLQGILYSSILVFLCICFVMIVFIQPLDSSYAVEVINSMFFPSQGFFNALIYMIPPFKQMMKKRRKKKIKRNMQSVIAQQLNTDSIQNQQKISSKILVSQTSFINGACIDSIRQDGEVESECKEEEAFIDNNNGISASKQISCLGDNMDENDDQEEQSSIGQDLEAERNFEKEIFDDSNEDGVSKQIFRLSDKREERDNQEEPMNIKQHANMESECEEEETLVDDNIGIGASKHTFCPGDIMEENNDQEEETPFNLNALYESDGEKVAMEEIKGEDSNIAAISSLMLSPVEEEEEGVFKSPSFVLPARKFGLKRESSSSLQSQKFELRKEYKSSSSLLSQKFGSKEQHKLSSSLSQNFELKKDYRSPSFPLPPRKSGLKREYKSSLSILSRKFSFRKKKDYKSFTLPRHFEFEGIYKVANEGNDSDDDSFVDDYLKMMED